MKNNNKKIIAGIALAGGLAYILQKDEEAVNTDASGSFGNVGGGGEIFEEGTPNTPTAPYTINIPTTDTNEVIRYITESGNTNDPKKSGNETEDNDTGNDPMSDKPLINTSENPSIFSKLFKDDKTKKATTITGMFKEGIVNDNVTQKELNNMSSVGVITNIITHSGDAFDRMTDKKNKGLADIDTSKVDKSDGSTLGNVWKYGIIDTVKGNVPKKQAVVVENKTYSDEKIKELSNQFEANVQATKASRNNTKKENTYKESGLTKTVKNGKVHVSLKKRK